MYLRSVGSISSIGSRGGIPLQPEWPLHYVRSLSLCNEALAALERFCASTAIGRFGCTATARLAASRRAALTSSVVASVFLSMISNTASAVASFFG